MPDTAERPYRILSGRTRRYENGEWKTLTTGDRIMLTKTAAERMGKTVEPIEEAHTDLETTSAPDLISRISQVTNTTELERMAEAERDGKGRVTVLRAIEERVAKLEGAEGEEA